MIGTAIERILVGILLNSWGSKRVVKAGDCVEPVLEFHLSGVNMIK